MNRLFYRAGQMLLGWGGVGVIYHLSDRLQGTGNVIAPSWGDSLIPYSTSGIWLYLSFFFIVPLGYFLAPQGAVRWLTTAMLIAALGAGGVYLLYPTTLVYPEVTGTSLSSQVLAALTKVDSAQNCFPSLHITLTILSVWAIAKSRCFFTTLVFVFWGIAIAYSILQVRRHLFIDLAGGAILAWCAGLLAQWMSREHKELKHE